MREQRFLALKAHGPFYAFGAVSYTHLDVYKRQLQRFLCQLVRIRIRSQWKDLLLHQIGNLFGCLLYTSRCV